MSDAYPVAIDDEPPDLLDRMIGAAGAGLADRVVIAVPRLDLLIGLLRLGFAGAACLAPNAACTEAPDVLLVPAAAETQAALPHLLRRLPPGATAVLHCTGNSRGTLRRLLQEGGFLGLRERRCGAGVLLAARKAAALSLSNVA
jgi:hypothetical protein